MSDHGMHQRLADLDQEPLDTHADVLDEVHAHIVSELDELRRAVPPTGERSAASAP